MVKIPKWKSHYNSEVLNLNDEEEVTLGGWVDTIRDTGKTGFVVLRDTTGKIQVVFKKEEIADKLKEKYEELTKESAISIKGRIKKNPIAPHGVEIVPNRLDILSSADPLPLDLSRNAKTSIDKRLDYRFLDLRLERNSSIFRIESELIEGFRQYFRKSGFREFFPPLIVAAATEGGSELFSMFYFDREAFLAQSPQLYKEYLTATNLEKVFCVTPVFRAEPYKTTRHLNQFIQVDIEEGFADDEDVMKELENTIYEGISASNKYCKEELEILKKTIEVPQRPFLKYTYSQVIDILKSLDHPLDWGSDLSGPEYRKLQEKFGKSWYFITKWPATIKPFYAYPAEDDPTLTRSFDLMYGLQEISSGSQRIHEYDMLLEKLKTKGLKSENFSFYLQIRKYGLPPHSGWSIGPERMVTEMLDLGNIREATLFPRDKDRLTP